jgi:hypothetical protein
MKLDTSFFDNPELLKSIENESLFRLETIVDFFDDLIKIKFFEGLYLNTGILFNAIESYYFDLQRAKYFHKIEFANQHKRAAFMMLWIAKIKPVMIDQNVQDKKLNKRQILANELFAILLGLNFLDINIDAISKKYLKNLIYTLHYRNVDGMVLSSQMYLLEISTKNIRNKQ